jgi:DNA-binding phage protein
MTTSRTTILSEIFEAERISDGTLGYFQERLLNEFHNVILEEFVRQENEKRITRATLARRIGRKPEQITRWLAVGGNWTVKTISDLVTAMHGQLRVQFVPLQAASTGAQEEGEDDIKDWLGTLGARHVGQSPILRLPDHRRGPSNQEPVIVPTVGGRGRAAA